MNIIQQKKRDCNLAVPLFEALVLPLHQNNNTVAHAVCTSIRKYARTLLYTHHEHLVLQCFGCMNLPDSE